MDLSPTAPIIKNDEGGMQSEIGCRLDLLDAKAILKLGEILDYGAKKYTPNNWRLIDSSSHMNHALVHAFAWLAGNRSDDHAAHFFTRAMMFLAKELENEK